MILLVGGEKGGIGKSILAVSLATARASQGGDVCIIDTDMQGSAALWSNIRASEDIKPIVGCVQRRDEGLGAAIRDLAGRYGDIIIDAGGRDSTELRVALTVADQVLYPIGHGLFDLGTLDKLSELTRGAQAVNPDLVASVVINRAETHPGMKDADEAKAVIRDYPNLKLLDVIVRSRIAFSRSVSEGRSVLEMASVDGKACRELMALYGEIWSW